MSESPSTQPISSTEASGGGRNTEVTRRSDGRGTTTIDENVVAKIAGIATREVSGVASMGGALSGAVAQVVGRIRGDEQHATSGVGVEVGTRQAAVDLSITVQYPAAITEVAQSVRENVIDRIETVTGLEVVEVNIAVTDLAFPGGEQEGDESRVE